jgi:hypothetical protein
MAMTPEQFAIYMQSPIEYELGRATRAGMTTAAQEMKSKVKSAVDAKAPNGLKTRKGGGRGKIGIYYEVYGHVNAFAVVASRGPLPLIENDTPPHMITPLIGKAKGRGSGARNRAAKAARSSGYVGGMLGRRTGIFVRGSYQPGGLATFARHPGTKGSRVFEKTAEGHDDAMSAAIEAALGPVGE